VSASLRLQPRVSEPLERITMENITRKAAEQKSYNCLKGSRISAADNYITFQTNIVSCLKGA
jgi:hypothetical protein